MVIRIEMGEKKKDPKKRFHMSGIDKKSNLASLWEYSELEQLQETSYLGLTS
jgi:hypothetical protein